MPNICRWYEKRGSKRTLPLSVIVSIKKTRGGWLASSPVPLWWAMRTSKLERAKRAVADTMAVYGFKPLGNWMGRVRSRK